MALDSLCAQRRLVRKSECTDEEWSLNLKDLERGELCKEVVTLQFLHFQTKLASPLLPETSFDSWHQSGLRRVKLSSRHGEGVVVVTNAVLWR